MENNKHEQHLLGELEKLKKENEELKRKVEEYYDLWQNELMERDNYDDI